MAFRAGVLSDIGNSYDNFSEHYRDVRAFFEIIDVRFAIAEYGVSLKCLAGKKLFSNASDYLLHDDSAYPFYLWTPSWLGRFYIDPAQASPGVAVDDLRIGDTRLVAYIWLWLGFNDAYVSDAQPECWFGVAEPRADDPALRVYDVADMMWKYFRVERTTEGLSDGWLQGHFLRNTKIGCALDGQWHMRRVPLTELTSFYQIEKLLIRPLGEKFAALAAENPAPTSMAQPVVTPDDRLAGD